MRAKDVGVFSSKRIQNMICAKWSARFISLVAGLVRKLRIFLKNSWLRDKGQTLSRFKFLIFSTFSWLHFLKYNEIQNLVYGWPARGWIYGAHFCTKTACAAHVRCTRVRTFTIPPPHRTPTPPHPTPDLVPLSFSSGSPDHLCSKYTHTELWCKWLKSRVHSNSIIIVCRAVGDHRDSSSKL